MSIHTKIILAAALLANFSVCVMAYVSVDADVLPTFAVVLVPYAVFGWGAAGVSYGLDLIVGTRA